MDNDDRRHRLEGKTITMHNVNKTVRSLLLVTVTLFSAWGCSDLQSPSFNDPSTEELQGSPDRAEIAGAAVGLIDGQRGTWQTEFVENLGVFGREAYDLRPEEPRTITERLIDPLIGENDYWENQYEQLQNAYLLLSAADSAETLSEAEREAIRGFAKTFMAQSFWEVVIMHEPLPVPVDVNRAPTDSLAPLVEPGQVYQNVFTLFDEAAGHLDAAGGSFPFDLPDGFANFSTPSDFRQLNRALKARALKYRGRWGDVLTALDGSFVDTTRSFDYGAYFDYSTQSGDATNGLAAQRGSNWFAHPRLWRDARQQNSGDRDLRALEKLSGIDAYTLRGITVTEVFDVYTSLSDPIPWIQNEELILIRAEANRALENDQEAIRDLNTVRTRAGGLEPLASSFSGDLLGEILYDKRYSLMFEGGFTYLDAMQYGRTADQPDELPRLDETHVVYPRYPYPNNECLARGIEDDPGCQPVEGF